MKAPTVIEVVSAFVLSLEETITDHCGEEGIGLEGRPFNLPVDLLSNGHKLLVLTERVRS